MKVEVHLKTHSAIFYQYTNFSLISDDLIIIDNSIIISYNNEQRDESTDTLIYSSILSIYKIFINQDNELNEMTDSRVLVTSQEISDKYSSISVL